MVMMPRDQMSTWREGGRKSVRYRRDGIHYIIGDCIPMLIVCSRMCYAVLHLGKYRVGGMPIVTLKEFKIPKGDPN